MLTSNQTLFLRLPKETITNEILYFNFLSRIYISDIVSNEQKLAMGKLFAQSTNHYCTFSLRILESIPYDKVPSTSLEHHYLSLYFLTLFNAFYDLLGTFYDALTHLFIPPTNFYLDTSDDLMTVLKASVYAVVQEQKQAHLASSLIYPLYKSKIKTTLHLYLEMTKDFTADYFIANRLHNLYNATNIPITDDYTKADLIITDTLDHSTNGTPVFYLDDVNNEKTRRELLLLVQAMYKQKLMND